MDRMARTSPEQVTQLYSLRPVLPPGYRKLCACGNVGRLYSTGRYCDNHRPGGVLK